MCLQPVAGRRQDLQPRRVLVIRFDDRPRGLTRAGPLDHVVDRLLVGAPLFAISPVFVGQLPSLVGEALAGPEAFELFVLGDVDSVLHEDHPVRDELALELIDLAVRPHPLGLRGEAFDAFDEHAPVPAAIEDRHTAPPGEIEVTDSPFSA